MNKEYSQNYRSFNNFERNRLRYFQDNYDSETFLNIVADIVERISNDRDLYFDECRILRKRVGEIEDERYKV